MSQKDPNKETLDFSQFSVKVKEKPVVEEKSKPALSFLRLNFLKTKDKKNRNQLLLILGIMIVTFLIAFVYLLNGSGININDGERFNEEDFIPAEDLE